MSFGDAASICVVAAFVLVLLWLLGLELRETYRAVRASGAPRVVAILLAAILALLAGC